MKYWITSILLLFSSVVIFAQEEGESRNKEGRSKVFIKGQVLNELGETIPYASVALYRKKDSTFIKGTATNQNGSFSLFVRSNAKVYLQISFLSYKTKTISNVTTSELLDLGKITLQENSLIMDAVEVVGERNQMELKLDKRVYNVSKDVTNKGANCSEILEKIASVDVDLDGNVSLRGSNNVRILLDGKPSALLSGNLANALKQLQGDEIERIEVVTNPSAKFDAEGEVGVINIVLKKEKSKGLTATLNGSLGYPGRYSANGSFNLRSKKYSVNGRLGLNQRESIGGGKTLQNYYYEDTSYSFQSKRVHSRENQSGNINLGAEFYLNKKNTLGFSSGIRKSVSNNETINTYEDFDENEQLDQTQIRKDISDGYFDSYDVSAYYYKSFRKKGREWNTIFKAMQYDAYSLANITDEIDNQLIGNNQRSIELGKTQTIYFQSDYIHPIKKDGNFEMGVKGSRKISDEDYDVEESISGNWSTMVEYDNHMIYTENITAGYLLYGNEIKAFSYQFGLRGEYSDVTTFLIQTDENNPRTYMNWFPSVHLSYELEKQTFLQTSYSRRISRPRHWWLNPFFGISDNRNFRVGNPNLDPKLTDSYELSYLKKFDYSSFLVSAYYRYSTNVMEWVTTVDSLAGSFSRPENIGVEDVFGLEVNGNLSITKNWSLSGNVNFFRSIVDGSYEGRELNNDSYNLKGKLSSRWKIKKVWSFQSSFRYNAPTTTTQGKKLAMYTADIGVSKEILRKKGTISFNVRDVFNTRIRRSVFEGSFYTLNSDFQWRSRTAILNVSYRINQKTGRSKKGRENYEGMDDMEMM